MQFWSSKIRVIFVLPIEEWRRDMDWVF